MHRGYVKLWRKVIDSAVFMDEGLLKVWIWCLTKANWEAKTVSFKAGRMIVTVELQPGQFVFGRQSAANELGMKPSTVRNRISRLCHLGNLDSKVDRHHSVITICNWNIYADSESSTGQASGLREDTERTLRGHSEESKTLEEASISSQNGRKRKRKEYSEAFELFWESYPRRDGAREGKADAARVFETIPDEDRIHLSIALENYKRSKKVKDGFAKDASGWLNKENWRSWLDIQDNDDVDRFLTTEELKAKKHTWN